MIVQPPSVVNEILISDILTAEKNRPLIISIAGGSATGKTSLVTKKIFDRFTQVLDFNPLVIAQDNFQIGRPFVKQFNSPYKWDDPRNFDLPRCAEALYDLIASKRAEIPTFSVHQAQRIGTQSAVLGSSSVILFEGLYSFYTAELLELSNYKIFVQSHFYARLLRRIFRFVYELKIPDFEVALRQMVLTVQLANKVEVSKQRQNSDLVIQTPYSFSETYDRFDLNGRPKFAIPNEPRLYSVSPEAELELLITSGRDTNYFNVIYKGQNYFRTWVNDDVITVLRETDPYSCD